LRYYWTAKIHKNTKQNNSSVYVFYKSGRKIQTISSASTPTGDITEIYWKLVEINGESVKWDGKAEQVASIFLKDEDNLFTGNGGCNTLFGTYEIGVLRQNSQHARQRFTAFTAPVVFQMRIIASVRDSCKVKIDRVRQKPVIYPYFV
jgi:hypothetical protein